MLYKLAHRLITTSEVPSFYSPDRFYVHILILKELGLYEEAAALLESEKGKDICGRSLICDELRREIWVLKGSVKEEGQRAQDRILKKECVGVFTRPYPLVGELTLLFSFIATATGWSSCLC